MREDKHSEVQKLNGVGVRELDSSKSSPIWRQLLATGGTVLLTIGAGCTSGYSAVLVPQLQLPSSSIFIDLTMMSWVAAISCLPLFVGNLISGFLMERFGRRLTQLILAIPFVSGWCIIAFSGSIHLILLGRFTTGLCQGILGPFGPVFVGEISTPRYRGFLLAALSLSIAVGVLASHTLGTFLHWKLTAILCGIFPALAYIILLYVPESPSWLAAKGRIQDCTNSFRWYRGCGEEANIELTKMIAQYTNKTIGERQSFVKRLRSNIRKPEFRKPLEVMTVFFIMTQLTGTNVICSYTAIIMKNLIGDSVSEYTAMLVVDILRCVALMGACVLLRRVGRRPLAMFSGSFTALSLIVLAAYIYLVRSKVLTNSSPVVTVGLICFYIVISSIGVVPLPWTMVGEIFPTATRGLGSGISVMMTSLAFFATVKTAPGLFKDIGQDGTFLFYGCSTLVGTIYLYFYLPETKGKTLLQVEENFIRGKKPSHCNGTDNLVSEKQGNA